MLIEAVRDAYSLVFTCGRRQDRRPFRLSGGHGLARFFLVLENGLPGSFETAVYGYEAEARVRLPGSNQRL